MNHVQATPIINSAVKAVFPQEVPFPAVQILRGIARLETGYGTGWKGEGEGSNNWGAIINPSDTMPCDPRKSFTYRDSRPTESGEDEWYSICFRKYATPVEGATDLCRTAYVGSARHPRHSVFQAAVEGDIKGVSAELYDTGYYAGRGPTRESRIRSHFQALRTHIFLACRELREKLPRTNIQAPPTLRLGKRHASVALLREFFELPSDVMTYDSALLRNVRTYQRSRGLTMDGIVGPITWTELIYVDKYGGKTVQEWMGDERTDFVPNLLAIESKLEDALSEVRALLEKENKTP